MPELQPIFFLSAFIAGTVTFLAPCTLPLLPAYLGFISGVTEKEIKDSETSKWARKRILKNSIMFTLGFSIVLIFFGMSAGFLGSFITPHFRKILSVAGGLLIVLFGLFMVGALDVAFLTSEHRVKVPKWLKVGNTVSSFLLGLAFAVGWTPCIGPVYGTILFYAGSTSTAFTGAMLLALFALGFSVPLIALAILISQATHIVEKFTPYLRIISIIGGIVLILLGVSLLFGDTKITNWFFDFFNKIDFESIIMPYT